MKGEILDRYEMRWEGLRGGEVVAGGEKDGRHSDGVSKEGFEFTLVALGED